jgi:threonine/homoserine/homoserine lactone efflux protein
MLKTSSGSQSGQPALASLEKRLAGSEPDDSAVPSPVRKSVRFMLGGALVTAVSSLFSVITVIAVPTLINNGKQPTSHQVSGYVIQTVVLTIVFCSLWVAMARMNRAGRSWARIVASALFALSTISLFTVVNSLHAGDYIRVYSIVSFVLAVVEWICGLGAVALLWRPESSAYFKSRSAAR